MEGHTALTTGLTSQIISNVPAAVLLSGFTADWRGLLVGSNLGGLGTPIASLASLISLKVYLRTPGARPGRYLLLFTGGQRGCIGSPVPMRCPSGRVDGKNGCNSF